MFVVRRIRWFYIGFCIILGLFGVHIASAQATPADILANMYDGGCNMLGVATLEVDSSPMRLVCPYSAGHSYTVEVYELAKTDCTPSETVSDSGRLVNALTTKVESVDEWCIKIEAFNDTAIGYTAVVTFNRFYTLGIELGVFDTAPLSVSMIDKDIFFGGLGSLVILALICLAFYTWKTRKDLT